LKILENNFQDSEIPSFDLAGEKDPDVVSDDLVSGKLWPGYVRDKCGFSAQELDLLLLLEVQRSKLFFLAIYFSYYY
jgi:hypothetical protein